MDKTEPKEEIAGSEVSSIADDVKNPPVTVISIWKARKSSYAIDIMNNLISCRIKARTIKKFIKETINNQFELGNPDVKPTYNDDSRFYLDRKYIQKLYLQSYG